jgi:hypothetical protein
LTRKANTSIPSTFRIFLKYHLNSKLTIETTYQKTTPHPHPTPKGVGPASGTMPSKVDRRQAKEKETEEEAVQKMLAPGGRKLSLRNTKRTAAATPPREDINKAIRPTGTSPMKDSKDNNLEVNSLKETMRAWAWTPQQNWTPARSPPMRTEWTTTASRPLSQLCKQTSSKAIRKTAQHPKKNLTQPPNQARRKPKAHLGFT